MHAFFTPYTTIPLSKNDRKIINADIELSSFQQYEISIEGLKQSILDLRKRNFDTRFFLDILKKQYAKIGLTEAFEEIISIHFETRTLLENKIEEKNIFTVCCAHQPVLLGGALYTLLKIIDCIQLCNELAKHEPSAVFIPVFFIGNEDHDIEELTTVSVFNKSLKWQIESRDSSGLWQVNSSFLTAKNQLFEIIKNTPYESDIHAIIENSFWEERPYGECFQRFIHHIFGKYGVLTFNPLDKEAKQRMQPIFEDELRHSTSYNIVQATNQKLQNHLSIQANPREINLFYADEDGRNRIVKNGQTFDINTSDKVISQKELIEQTQTNIERFSPNVLLRPLYQQLIFPNIAFVGGGAEISYWLQLHELFQHYHIHFPALVRRSSVVFLDKITQQKLDKANLSARTFIEHVNKLENYYMRELAEKKWDINPEMNELKATFNQLFDKIEKNDKPLFQNLQSDKVKVQHFLDSIESKYYKNEKTKHEIVLQQLRNVKEKILPNDTLHERTDSYIQYIAKFGFGIIDFLIAHQRVLNRELLIVEE